VLAWEINSEWKHDVLVQTVVEVRFIPQGPTTTRVELEHRDLEAYGEKAAAMQDHLQGWATVLEGFVTLANATGSPNASRTAGPHGPPARGVTAAANAAERRIAMKLHVAPPSPRAFKVLAVAHHLGLDFELIPVDLLNGANLRPEFVALNPNKKM